MKILLAPAETKQPDGKYTLYSKENFYFKEFFDTTNNIVENYELLLKNSTIEELSKWFGLKNIKECERYSISILHQPTMKAIQRYAGVAFDALDYNSLTQTEQQYCDNNIVLFSNLFGILKGSDLIPDYKFKQGAVLPNIDVIKEYKGTIKDTLDSYLGDEVIDLRAAYYDKVYKPSAPTITFKFLKDGKVVSHWAKYYRGLIVNQLAKNSIQSFAELMSMEVDNLSLLEIQEKKNIKTLIMNIK